jgi:hypothetical protein
MNKMLFVIEQGKGVRPGLFTAFDFEESIWHSPKNGLN